jgi:hypothetical protein
MLFMSQSLQLGLERLQFLIQGDFAVELLFTLEASGELIDLALESEIGFAAACVSGERFSFSGRKWQERSK